MNIKLQLLLLSFLVGVSIKCLGTKLTQSQIQKLKTSIVRVKTTSTNKIGTGFIYVGAKYVVTAYHVVSGSNGYVKIVYESLGLERDGKVIKTLKNADLALIEITNPIQVPILKGSTAIVDYNTEYTAIGFLWDAKDYFPIDVTKKETRNLNFLPLQTRSDIISAGCPSLSLDVFSFAGNPLVPGFSGSPIFNSNEEIIAVGDGGIKEGLASVSWGIPSSNLSALFSSSVNELGSVLLTHTLYAADNIQSTDWENDFLTINNEKFNKTRTEELQTIANTTDDVNGLNMLLNTFPAQIEKNKIKFDVYQNFSNGAIFVLPTGFNYTQEGNSLTVKSKNGNVDFSIDIEHCSYTEMFPLTQQLEKAQLTSQSTKWNWRIDPSFTYMSPVTRSDGFMVRRGAYSESQYDWTTNTTNFNDYLFESFVYKNNLLMYLKVKNYDYNTEYLRSRLPCDQTNFTGAGCDTKLAELEDWMKMVVAVHFATFSN